MYIYKYVNYICICLCVYVCVYICMNWFFHKIISTLNTGLYLCWFRRCRVSSKCIMILFEIERKWIWSDQVQQSEHLLKKTANCSCLLQLSTPGWFHLHFFHLNETPPFMQLEQNRIVLLISGLHCRLIISSHILSKQPNRPYEAMRDNHKRKSTKLDLYITHTDKFQMD